MSSNKYSTADTGIPEPITPHAPIDLPTESTPRVHKRNTAKQWTTNHEVRDDSLIAIGNEIVGHVVGPMPANEFLELLPYTIKPLPAETKVFTNLADKTAEGEMYDPFVCIPFSLLYA